MRMTKRILVVAGDAGQLRDLRGILEPLGAILEAPTCRHALRLVATEKPDLMILDEALAEMDGVSVTQAAHFLDPALPIVILAEEPGLLEAGRRPLGDGPSAYVKKPADPAALRDEVRRLFTRKIFGGV
jgi:CheY-like chemotaxis protein